MKQVAKITFLALTSMIALIGPPRARADVSPTTEPSLDTPGALQSFYDSVRPSMVAVKYQWHGELASQEVVGAGVVVREDGLVMLPLILVADVIPDAQMKDFKLVIPSDTSDSEEVDATFVGRDDRGNVAFVKAKDPTRKWSAINFKEEPVNVGDKIYSVGLLPKAAGYKAYLTEASVAATLRGEEPQVLVSGGGLASVGGVVFNQKGEAIGWVTPQLGQQPLLDNGNELGSIMEPPRFFIPTRFFQISLDDPPQEGKPLHIPWSGITQMTGVSEDLAKFLDLKNRPAAEIGDVAPGGPAERAGLHANDIIVALDGKPLERGDLPEEIPNILRRAIVRMKVGDTATFTVMVEKGQPTRDVAVTLEERPPMPGSAHRYYASDLGFVAREAVFQDRYLHKVKGSDPAVVIDLVKRDGAAATAKLAPQDLVTQLNGQPVGALDDFETAYKSFRQDHPHDAVVLVVNRLGGREETINIEPPVSAPGAPSGGTGEP